MTTVPSITADPFPVIAIATSAGGLNAMRVVLSGLTPPLNAAIVLVQHLDPHHRSLLAEILGRSTAIAIRQAADGDRLQPGTMLIAPPDHHVLINPDGSISLSKNT